MTKTISPLVLCALAGCAAVPAQYIPGTHKFVLNVDSSAASPPSTGASWQNSETLLVSALEMQPGFETPRMIYMTRPREIESFAENEWAAPPAVMLGRVMEMSLRNKGSWKAVVMRPTIVPGRYELETKNLALYQDFTQKPSSVRLSLSETLIDLKENRVVCIRDFAVVQEAQNDDPYGGVVAANQAAKKLMDELTLWLNSCNPARTANHKSDID